MICITKDAAAVLAKYLADAGDRCPRIDVQPGCCGEAKLKLVLDSKKETDLLYEVDGFGFIIDKDLAGHLESVKVEHYPRVGLWLKYTGDLNADSVCGASCCPA